jgi:hypothetical protein
MTALQFQKCIIPNYSHPGWDSNPRSCSKCRPDGHYLHHIAYFLHTLPPRSFHPKYLEAILCTQLVRPVNDSGSQSDQIGRIFAQWMGDRLLWVVFLFSEKAHIFGLLLSMVIVLH